jgi:hypothetical protein
VPDPIFWSDHDVLAVAERMHWTALSRLLDPDDPIDAARNARNAWDDAHPQDRQYWLRVARDALEGVDRAIDETPADRKILLDLANRDPVAHRPGGTSTCRVCFAGESTGHLKACVWLRACEAVAPANAHYQMWLARHPVTDR